jgi:hypothetical protein
VTVGPSQDPEDAAATAAIDVHEVRSVNELEVAREFVRQTREAVVSLTGPDGLLKAMTRTVIEPSRTTNSPSIRAMTLTIRLDTEVKTAATVFAPRSS